MGSASLRLAGPFGFAQGRLTRRPVPTRSWDGRAYLGCRFYAPWHFLYFLPEPQGQGSLRPTFSCERTTCCTC
jgi:hypothetical protein